ncbi:MAG: metallophosphoesterase [Lachnospiraceae bacterium]|nr:metallophosphoesterase [Lachnospiraceae bacterium]
MNDKYKRLFITGDTHGERARFTYKDLPFEKIAKEGDVLIVAGDFGFLWDENSTTELEFRKIFIEKQYTTCFIDGNHENFDMIESFPVSEWQGGKVHIIEADKNGEPKLIHLMRGQVYKIAEKKIFTLGGGYSIDKYMRRKGESWWSQEMPTDIDFKESLTNLSKHNNKVDYVVTHAAREKVMEFMFGRDRDINEKQLNNFLEYIYENTEFEHWYFAHLHDDKDISYNETLLWYDTRNMLTNKVVIDYEDRLKSEFIFGNQNRRLKKLANKWQNGNYEAFGVYTLVGPPASGKTTFLESLKFDDVRWINGEELDGIIKGYIGGGDFEPSEDIIFIEDIDYLMTNEYKAKALTDLLKALRMNSYGEKRLIICSLNNKKNLINFVDFPVLFIDSIKITKHLVKEKAKLMNVKLTTEELQSLSSLENILDVLEELKRNKLYDMVIGDE